jgi:hypothetical protein
MVLVLRPAKVSPHIFLSLSFLFPQIYPFIPAPHPQFPSPQARKKPYLFTNP